MKNLLVILFILCSANVSAQDVIVKKDGATIVCRVVEVTATEITYIKWGDLNGSNYVMDKSLVSGINYKSGKKETFPESVKTEIVESKSGIEMALPDDRNNQLINLYNTPHDVQPIYKKSNLSASYACCIIGIDNNSIISTNDFEIYLYRHKTWTASFKIMLYNKSNHIIYVDMGNSFKIRRNGSFSMYYDTSQTTITQGTGSNVGLQIGSVANAFGIGGIIGNIASGLSVGSGNSSSISTTYFHQRILAIPPGGTHELETIYYDKIMKWIVNKGELLRGVKKTYDVNNSKVKAQIIISYSDNENFNSIRMLNATFFVREIIGIHKSDMDWGLFDKSPEKALKKSIDSILTNYDEYYTIIGKFKIEE